MVSSLSAIIVAAVYLQSTGKLGSAITPEHYHDLGKFLLAFVVFWGYMGFSQYMLMWYANIPEETWWYLKRQSGGWLYVTVGLLAGHLLIPFFGLLSREVKRRRQVLACWAIWLLVFHWVDMYWLVMPSLGRSPPAVRPSGRGHRFGGRRFVSGGTGARGGRQVAAAPPRPAFGRVVGIREFLADWRGRSTMAQKDDIQARLLFLYGFLGCAVVLVIVLAMMVLYYHSDQRLQYERTIRQPYVDLENATADQQTRLVEYEKLADVQENGVTRAAYRIPLDRAKELVLNEWKSGVKPGPVVEPAAGATEAAPASPAVAQDRGTCQAGRLRKEQSHDGKP